MPISAGFSAATASRNFSSENAPANMSCCRTECPARRSAFQLRRACQRGMATAEYAVGILAAVALALVLLKIFNDNEFFTTMLRFVLDLIGRVGGMVG